MRIKDITTIIIVAALAISNMVVGTAANASLPVIPAPEKYTAGEGTFRFTQQTTFGVENEAQLEIIANFISKFGNSAGYIPTVSIGNSNADVVLQTEPSLPHEAYKLNVSSSKITISASGEAGFFYALQTIRQLLPSTIEGDTLNSNILSAKEALSKIPLPVDN